MIVPRTVATYAGLAVVASLGLVGMGCIDRPVTIVRPATQQGVAVEVPNEAVDKVDLLLEVDNSNSMRENQEHIAEQLGSLINTLTNPPIDPATMRPRYPPVRDLHVGVVSSDLGTPGAQVRGCDHTDHGDDGRLNPIRYGDAMRVHEPWTTAPTTFRRPADCNRADQFPAFINFVAGTTNATTFTHDFECNAALYVGGCGLEQQLEAVWRALITHGADRPEGSGPPNAGFLREEALLAILILSDEEDGSVQDCRYAEAGQPCESAIEPASHNVFDQNSPDWQQTNLNLRFYRYDSCGPRDPTWHLDRYMDPTNPNRGFLSVKPGHPERVVFAAITGVPLDVPMVTDGVIDWDQLLGRPNPMNRDDYCARDTSTAYDNPTHASGPISMRQNNPDLQCNNGNDRVVPSCRRQGSAFNPAMPGNFCAPDQQYFAWPARRLVEVARRFDQSTLCSGPCNNGIVTSICANNYEGAMQLILNKIQSRLTGRCLPRQLQGTFNGNDRSVRCEVRIALPPGSTCDAALGRCPHVDGMTPMPGQCATGTAVTDPRTNGPLCDVLQVPFTCNDPNNCGPGMPAAGAGWYYNTNVDPADPMQCRQQISFTGNASPPSGSRTYLECIQSVSGM
jgi:hypothetical protein